MKILNKLSIVILICFTTLASAQNKVVEYGEPKDAKALYQVLGEINGQIAIRAVTVTVNSSYSMLNPGGSTINDSYLIYNKDLSFHEEVQSDSDLRKAFGEKIIDVSVQDGYLSKLVLDINGKKKKRKLRVLPFMMNEPQKPKTLVQFKEETYIRDYKDKTLFFKKYIDVISTFKSKNKSKLAVLIDNKKKVQSRIIVLDRKNNYDIIGEYSLDLPTEKNKRSIVDLSVNDDGNVAVLVKNYNSSGGSESKKGKPNYNLEIFRVTAEGQTSRNVENNDLFSTEPILLLENNDEIYLSCLLSEKKDSKFANIFAAKYDKNFEPIYESSYTHKNVANIKSKNGNHYSMISIMPINDNLTISTSLNFKSRTTGELISHRHHFKGLTLDAIDGNGKYLWSKTIEKNDKQPVVANNISPNIYYSENGVEIFMNFGKKSIGQFMASEPKDVKYPTKENILTRVIVDTKGKVTMEEISEVDNYSFGSNIILNDYEYYFMLNDHKFKKIRFAKAKF